MAQTTDRVWSDQQDAIFHWFETSQINQVTVQNLIARARAGTGKTTTIIEGINRAPEQNILLAAFNTRIAKELANRITNPCAQAKTLHAIGFQIVRNYWENIRVCDPTWQRERQLTDAVCDGRTPDAVKRLVGKLHTKAREIAPRAQYAQELMDIAITFDCEPDDVWEAQGFDTMFVAEKALEAMQVAAATKPAAIDFADMIFLPIRNGWMMKQYDLVVVDEAQDMTLAQLELAQGVCKGRFCIVGDDRQAIYGFRGADSGSLDRLKLELNAGELGLTTTYRCGRAIVTEAQKLVADFQAGPQNSDGEIITLHDSKLMDTVGLGDFVLSRLNAPLVPIAMSLLKQGKRARIAGKDIGAGLKNLLKKLAKGRAANSVPEFLSKLNHWREKEVARFLAIERQDRADFVMDQADMLTTLCEGATGLREVEAKIDNLFTDDGLGSAGVITCSSVHKAKGLEANRVLVLKDTLYPRKKQSKEEQNIHYVAITRAKQTLFYVSANAPLPAPEVK